ncbi:VOC family protein [Sunxiuqinia sp. A32]|uniref:VOC family protein n=1 Tax=Sunxiuqinia sp. A32 TaxID=3461496 RepID=UPI004045EEFC
MKSIYIFLFAGFLSVCANTTIAQDLSQYFAKNTIQVGVVVEDMDAALDFYMNVLGMVKRPGFSVDAEFAKRSGLSNGIPFDVTVLKLEDSDDAQEWKVMSFGKKANHPKQKYMSDDTGMQYTTILVKSMTPFLERIKKYNIELLGETPIKLDEQRLFVLIQDPDGNFFELIGPK